MTGEEVYPIAGDGFLASSMVGHTDILIEKCRGLNLYWNCLEKALIVREYIGNGFVILGSLYVHNEERSGNYGYEYNPPLEFHAWWQPELRSGSIIIDIALPGVILKGKSIVDEFGSILSGREPCILSGKPLDWMEYRSLDIFNI
jgi:hypothetical protein